MVLLWMFIANGGEISENWTPATVTMMMSTATTTPDGLSHVAHPCQPNNLFNCWPEFLRNERKRKRRTDRASKTRLKTCTLTKRDGDKHNRETDPKIKPTTKSIKSIHIFFVLNLIRIHLHVCWSIRLTFVVNVAIHARTEFSILLFCSKVNICTYRSM